MLLAVVVCAAASAAWLSGASKFEAEAAQIAELFELKPGMTVADVGAGKGKFTVSLAHRVGPTGRVFSTELGANRVADLRKAFAKSRLQNVMVVEGSEQGTNLPPECCDGILLRDVYHHFTRPESMDASLLRSLRPGGLIAVIDFPPKKWLSWVAPTKGVPKNRGGHGIPLIILLEEMSGAGFQKERVMEHWPDSHTGTLYCALFRRPATPAH
ncbi:MAG TPA: methyltransferase domain-containing protein [Candidatus Acidoferrales bacterium]|nr:methyltransferase domain-containing protein [Candidatus Acidoferrales bacterium]